MPKIKDIITNKIKELSLLIKGFKVNDITMISKEI